MPTMLLPNTEDIFSNIHIYYIQTNKKHFLERTFFGNLVVTNHPCVVSTPIQIMLLFHPPPKGELLFSSVELVKLTRLPTSIGNSVRFNWPHLTGESRQFIHTVGP